MIRTDSVLSQHWTLPDCLAAMGAAGVATARRAREEATKAELKVRENILAEDLINCWKSRLNWGIEAVKNGPLLYHKAAF